MTSQKLALNFFSNGTVGQGDNVFYCQTRDQSSARFSSWAKIFESYKVSKNNIAILIAILGELTNNSFDHNLGQWNGAPGCLVTFEKMNNALEIFIVDRGQGIISSLSPSLEKKIPPAEILKKAFEERISGRAPERRGNGLKFVLKYLKQTNNSLYCYSQSARYVLNTDAAALDESFFPKDFGTFLYIKWSLS
jgi:hypothetical protein